MPTANTAPANPVGPRDDELELGCVLCRQPVGARELVIFWWRQQLVAHLRCGQEATLRVGVPAGTPARRAS